MGNFRRHRYMAWNIFLLSCLFMIFMSCLPSPEVRADVTEEYKIKAAFVPNFAKFVKWPDEVKKGRRFVFEVAGRNPFGAALEPVNGQVFHISRAEVRYVDEWKPPGDDVRVVFISRSLRDSLDTILADLKQRSILTVSDIKGFAQEGGMIELAEREGTIHFIVNLSAIRAVGLNINYQLLQLADRVIRE